METKEEDESIFSENDTFLDFLMITISVQFLSYLVEKNQQDRFLTGAAQGSVKSFATSLSTNSIEMQGKECTNNSIKSFDSLEQSII